MTGFTVSRKMV